LIGSHYKDGDGAKHVANTYLTNSKQFFAVSVLHGRNILAEKKLGLSYFPLEKLVFNTLRTGGVM
jgi:hypothetical protein